MCIPYRLAESVCFTSRGLFQPSRCDCYLEWAHLETLTTYVIIIKPKKEKENNIKMRGLSVTVTLNVDNLCGIIFNSMLCPDENKNKTEMPFVCLSFLILAQLYCKLHSILLGV